MGFGMALIAISFFLIILQSGEAVQILIVMNLVITIGLAGAVWSQVDRALWGRLVMGAFLGFPVGLWVFSNADIGQLRIGVAVTILVFVAVTVLWKPSGNEGSAGRFRTPSALAVGAVAGALTASLGMPGPPVVLYLTGLGVGKTATRAIALSFFVIALGATLVLQVATVGVGASVWMSAGVLLPVAGVGSYVGSGLSKRISEAAFRTATLAVVAATGVYALIDVLF